MEDEHQAIASTLPREMATISTTTTSTSTDSEIMVDSILETEKCWKCIGHGIVVSKMKHKNSNHTATANKKQKHRDSPTLPLTTSTKTKTTSNDPNRLVLIPSNEMTISSSPPSTHTQPPNAMITTPKPCPVCQGSGRRPASKRSLQLGKQPGKIIQLRGNQGVFAGVRAVEGYKLLPQQQQQQQCGVDLLVQPGEILGALGCGDWRIYQLANGHKLTVDDFLCAWYAALEMRRRGYGVQQQQQQPQGDGDGGLGSGMFGQSPPSNDDSSDKKVFHHADLGCGCGSVLMTMAWAFPNTIRSHGVEAQEVSFDLCRRGLQFNLGQNGSDPSHTVQLTHADLREWDGGSLKPYDVITGTPPYFPKAHFVASQNHSQKIRCRIPTRGAASDYVATAAKLIKKDDGIICIAETARKEGEDAMWQAIQQHGLRVLRRLDVITRTGLPPRFSCWLLTNNHQGTSTMEYPAGTSNEDCIVSTPTSENNTCLIETLTIRNEDQSRTLDYVEAMESMGWVDFERTREKIKGTIPKEREPDGN
jgi:tRNA1(Val) A37 N6-methylase TrmN6